MARSVVWFRRDLRVEDNPALVAAAARGEIVALFVADPAVEHRSGANRRWFLDGSLAVLDERLGGHLVVRHGDPMEVVADVAAAADADEVIAASDVSTWSRRRDDAVRAGLERAGRRLRLVGSPFVVDPGTLRTGGGTPYRVFTPYWKQWSAHRHPDPAPAPTDLRFVAGIESEPRTPAPDVRATLPEPGEDAALRRLDEFCEHGVEHYAELRNDPGADATSRLSADLHLGLLHPRQVLARLDGRRTGHREFARQLCWRDFYGQILWQRPETSWENWRDDLDHLRVDEGPEADARFAAWAEGRTGYPLVDAGMRQLAGEGFVHNRVRMVTASFLVKDLHLDWRRGAAHFLEHLVDGDLASNNHGWQWVAGTGTDAAPYDRILNPTLQAERFDPDGTYIRRWIPELASVGDDDVHHPWTGGGLFHDYPAPIVDHAEERNEALRRLEESRRHDPRRAAPGSSDAARSTRR